MVIHLDKKEAEEIIRQQAKLSETDPGDPEWVKKVERLSLLCEQGVSKTHIAFLGTVMLAKAVDQNADLFSIKPTHADAGDRERSFSARTLCHGVLVPLAAELGISLGVTGREPLNNQPYFRMTRLDGSVNLIWPLLIFSFGSTPSGESTPAARRVGALRRP